MNLLGVVLATIVNLLKRLKVRFIITNLFIQSEVRMITEYNKYCIICGKPKDDTHHLLFGSKRHLSDEDEIVLPVCRVHHKFFHDSKEGQMCSKIIGQLAYERWYLGDDGDANKTLANARQEFRNRYGVSYL